MYKLSMETIGFVWGKTRTSLDIWAQPSYLYDMKRFARITARLYHMAASQLRYIIEHTKLSVSESIKKSLSAFYEQLRPRASLPKEILMHSKLVGCAEADPKLSSTYKEALKTDWTKKNSYR
jgi:hypothetical protein